VMYVCMLLLLFFEVSGRDLEGGGGNVKIAGSKLSQLLVRPRYYVGM